MASASGPDERAKWGNAFDNIADGRKEELRNRLLSWQNADAVEERPGPFSGEPLDGLEVFWLATCALLETTHSGDVTKAADQLVSSDNDVRRLIALPTLSLAKARLRWSNLSKANLNRANLRSADLHGADLTGADLSGTDLRNANLVRAKLNFANLTGANLSGAILTFAKMNSARLGHATLTGAHMRGAEALEADMSQARLDGADLTNARLDRANLGKATLVKAVLNRAKLGEANLVSAVLDEARLANALLTWANFGLASLLSADLHEADLSGANLGWARLHGANLRGADLSGARLIGADLGDTDLSDARLIGANLVRTNLQDAVMSGCWVYGTSVWDVQVTGATQTSLRITQPTEQIITVDDLEVAQFLYLMLHNEKIRKVIDTIARKLVLILGRFTAPRKKVLDALRERLRTHDYVPVLFDFDGPESASITETVTLLARMSRFVIADLTEPASVPWELAKIVPDAHVPVQTLLMEGFSTFAMAPDLWRLYPHLMLPLYKYKSLDELLTILYDQVIAPAEASALKLQHWRSLPPDGLR